MAAAANFCGLQLWVVVSRDLDRAALSNYTSVRRIVGRNAHHRQSLLRTARLPYPDRSINARGLGLLAALEPPRADAMPSTGQATLSGESPIEGLVRSLPDQPSLRGRQLIYPSRCRSQGILLSEDETN